MPFATAVDGPPPHQIRPSKLSYSRMSVAVASFPPAPYGVLDDASQSAAAFRIIVVPMRDAPRHEARRARTSGAVNEFRARQAGPSQDPPSELVLRQG